MTKQNTTINKQETFLSSKYHILLITERPMNTCHIVDPIPTPIVWSKALATILKFMMSSDDIITNCMYGLHKSSFTSHIISSWNHILNHNKLGIDKEHIFTYIVW